MPAISFAIEKRDLIVLQGLFETGVMTLDHAAVIYFDGRREAVKKRIQKLKSTGFIGDRPRNRFESAVHFLTRKGLQLLEAQGIFGDYARRRKGHVKSSFSTSTVRV